MALINDEMNEAIERYRQAKADGTLDKKFPVVGHAVRYTERAETTVSEWGKDEAWCMWYECVLCKNTMITVNSNFCPGCRAKIIRDTKV